MTADTLIATEHARARAYERHLLQHDRAELARAIIASARSLRHVLAELGLPDALADEEIRALVERGRGR